MFKKYFLLISKILFPVSFFVAIGIDAYYKFDTKETSPGYILTIIGYSYFCLFAAFFVAKGIFRIKKNLTKIFIYLADWILSLLGLYFIVENYKTDAPILWTVLFLLVSIFLISAFLLTLLVIFRILVEVLKQFSSLSSIILFFTFLATLLWFVLNHNPQAPQNQKQSTPTPTPTPTPVSVALIQSWQLNSRYKINAVVKFIKVDLDKDGKEELAAVTSYDKIPYTVFYYAGFYRYNPATEIWDEYYGEELNILYYKLKDEKIEADKLTEFNQNIVKMWSTEFTTLENLGDLTGDGCPEIAFSSLIQGKYFDNYIILAQAGESHYRFKVFSDQNSFAQILSEDGLLIEKYSDDTHEYKDIFEWDSKNLRFKLIESQKTKIAVPETPKIIPGLEELSS